MLKRYLDATNKKPVLSDLLAKFKGEPSIHQFSKAKLEEWIDKGADLERLRNIPIDNEEWDNDLQKINDRIISRKTEKLTDQYYFQPAVGIMDLYENRNYKTIGEAFKSDISYYFKTWFTYKGVGYERRYIAVCFTRSNLLVNLNISNHHLLLEAM